jgi:hypothetical protein
MHYFITSYIISHLEKNGSVCYANLPNVDIFHCTMSKTTLIEMITVLLEKSLSIGNSL